MNTDTFTRYDIVINQVSGTAEAIPPVFKADGKIDLAAMDDYDEFIFHVFSVLDCHELEIIEEETDPETETSYCITAIGKSGSTAGTEKYVFSINMAGQYSPEAFESAKMKSLFHSKLTWAVRNVVINGDVFDSYDEALDGLDKKLM